jgi:hypothetical protein
VGAESKGRTSTPVILVLKLTTVLPKRFLNERRFGVLVVLVEVPTVVGDKPHHVVIITIGRSREITRNIELDGIIGVGGGSQSRVARNKELVADEGVTNALSIVPKVHPLRLDLCPTVGVNRVPKGTDVVRVHRHLPPIISVDTTRLLVGDSLNDVRRLSVINAIVRGIVCRIDNITRGHIIVKPLEDTRLCLITILVRSPKERLEVRLNIEHFHKGVLGTRNLLTSIADLKILSIDGKPVRHTGNHHVVARVPNDIDVPKNLTNRGRSFGEIRVGGDIHAVTLLDLPRPTFHLG